MRDLYTRTVDSKLIDFPCQPIRRDKSSLRFSFHLSSLVLVGIKSMLIALLYSDTFCKLPVLVD